MVLSIPLHPFYPGCLSRKKTPSASSRAPPVWDGRAFLSFPEECHIMGIFGFFVRNGTGFQKVFTERPGKELFGVERMLNALNLRPDAKPDEILENVNEEVNRFVGDAVQFDDLTMLAFRYDAS